jgi:hypothetical protein
MIVISPTDRWMKAALLDCSASLVVSSPYVGAYFSEAVANLRESISITLLTRTLITDFASYASDLEAVYQLAKRSGGVFSLSSLHAKVYIVDQSKALITSANATFSGMHRNRECGLEVTSLREIQSLFKLIHCGFGAMPAPKLWSPDDLAELREPVKALRAALPRVSPRGEEAAETPPRVELPRHKFNRLIESFSGWTQLTLEGLSQIQSDVFTMEQVWLACAPLAKRRFPHNRYIREKLRQQMQRLRDLGLVLFLGKGRYERLATMR